ncbi:tRNA-binding protein [Aquimarina muelleri]|uniref:tRNA-binding protein n=1 Tax=Aquimarina muelleri TaxID=279356 RepID=A0A918JWT0_9FLAO|nr:tRNA-binding protein [Aquimarina muelleri]MCX2764413.1 tRNA-binding protein [Aquimarina muelleri]GGX21165.1 tRNA-binding protein [Aquimarina muelleri]
MEKSLQWSEFMKVDMRVGTIINVEVFEEARNPSYKMIIDFGELGHRKTSAQITQLYDLEGLVGKQVVAVVNFPPKQIANMMSECLVLGAVGEDKEVTLLTPDLKVKNGLKIG